MHNAWISNTMEAVEVGELPRQETGISWDRSLQLWFTHFCMCRNMTRQKGRSIWADSEKRTSPCLLLKLCHLTSRQLNTPTPSVFTTSSSHEHGVFFLFTEVLSYKFILETWYLQNRSRNFPLCGSRKFISLFINSHHWTLYRVCYNQSFL
jgi:hypothetical protein